MKIIHQVLLIDAICLLLLYDLKRFIHDKNGEDALYIT